jgi:hypothetical protein
MLLQGGIITGAEINPTDMISGLTVVLIIVVVLFVVTVLVSH